MPAHSTSIAVAHERLFAHFHLQVGQCGNQVGCRFWELALREHAAYNAGGRYDDALSSFFDNVDSRTVPPTRLSLGSQIRTLKVRVAAFCHHRGMSFSAVCLCVRLLALSACWHDFSRHEQF